MARISTPSGEELRISMSMTSLGYSLEPPEDQQHYRECLSHEDRTGFACIDCGEEIEEDAETCTICKAERYDRSICVTCGVEDVYDNGPLTAYAYCTCDEVEQGLLEKELENKGYRI
jgi:hypothetical protein